MAVKLAANDSQEFNISVSVTEQEGDATPSSPVVQTFSVTVAEVSDNATLAFKDSSGNAVSAAITGDHIVEDQAVPLFNGTLTDLIAASNQGNYLSGLQSLIVATPGDVVGTPETITQINISIVDGSDNALTNALIAHYSALYDDVSDTGNVSAKITNLGGGSFSITAEAEVDGSGNPTGNYVLPQGLVIVPPTDHNGELKLNVTAIAQDGTASTLQSSASTLSFTLLAQSESAEVDTSNISTTEDTVVAISIEPTKADENGVLTIEISGVPDGATLGTNNGGTYTSFAEQSVGTITTVTSGDPAVTTYTYTLAEANLTNLAISPPNDFSGSFALGLSVTETVPGQQASAPTTDEFTVTVSAVSDAPVVVVPATSANPDDSSITATIHALEDQTGGILIDRAVDGTTPTVIATAQDLIGTPEEIVSFRINLSAYPDGSYLALSSTNPDDASDPVNIGGGIYSIAAIPIDASAGTYTLPRGLSLHLPQDYNSVISLAANDAALIDSSLGNGVLKLPITAVSRDGALSATIESSSSTDNSVLKIYIAPLSEPPSAVNAPNATGTEDGYVALAVTVDKASPAGILSTTVSGIPEGSILGLYDSSGDSWTPFTPNADGTYTLSDSQVDLSAANNLAVKLAANDSQEFNVSVSVTEQEGDATPSSPVVQTFSVTVAEVSDNATLAFKDSSGNAVSAAITGDHIVEDQAVPLFNGTLTDLIAASNQGNYLSGLQSLIVATPGDIVGTPETITQINISIVDGSDNALTTRFNCALLCAL